MSELNQPGVISRILTAAAFTTGLSLSAPGAADAQFGGYGPGGGPGAPSHPSVAAAPYSYPPGTPLAPLSDEPVDVRLLLVIDASSSMSKEEYDTQIDITVQALTSDRIFTAWFGNDPARGAGAIRSIAIAVVDFGAGATLRVPWVDIRAADPGARERLAVFAGQIAGLKESRDMSKGGSTELAGMLTYAQGVIANAPWQGRIRTIVDVISDGENIGGDMAPPRRALAAMGVTVNALAIVNEKPELDTYYRQKLVTQPGDVPRSSNLMPGRVWAIARNMKAEGNEQASLRAFSEEAANSFHQKIVWETVLRDIVPDELDGWRNLRYPYVPVKGSVPLLRPPEAVPG